ncbi:Ferroporti-1 [Irpex rosettiformis]|uniref:Ferroporti-1 n=1 Tax=Irpex rosettiformis TaxID=378272 RepID=A0ACB8UDB9_9APHY|nr:Ferroporti-1 [Irpex rosettiformis]
MNESNTDPTQPLLPSRAGEHDDEEAADSARFDKVGLSCLLVQHLSSAWGVRTAEFALYLYLIVYFKDTLLPSSILGFSMTATGILFSRWAGSLVDKYGKLPLVRTSIIVQKIAALLAYLSFMVMLSEPTNGIGPLHLFNMKFTKTPTAFTTPTFFFLVASSCVLHLSNTTISIAVERDWATCIAQGPFFSMKLSRLNTYLRQINLLCKLCAPLFVSFLTVSFDHTDTTGGETILSVKILAIVTVISLFFELYWIGTVYRRFPVLELEQQRRKSELLAPPLTEEIEEDVEELVPAPPPLRPTGYMERFLNLSDWKELVRLPIFFSSLAISLLYLTVLSFDGIMVGYLKTISYSDDFIAEMRGICVITGLIGTALALPLEKKIGTVRAGNWSIWSMVFTLIPVIVSFYVFAPRSPTIGTPKGSTLGVIGAMLLFGGMALSRIGLWSFDLIQTKQLQTALDHHPRRNTLTALQYTMQSVADLAKFVMTMILWEPFQFRWAALISFLSVSTGALVYAVYVKKERGHIAHLPPNMTWLKKIL